MPQYPKLVYKYPYRCLSSKGCVKKKTLLYALWTVKLLVLKTEFKKIDIFRYDSHGFNHPTDPFTIPETHDQGIDEFYVVRERRATVFEFPKLQNCENVGRTCAKIFFSIAYDMCRGIYQ